MFERRGSRFAIEVLVLIALAVSATIAQLNTLAIVGVMLLGWLVVSVLEWASLGNEAHYASGLPPRYYVPELVLPARTSEEYREPAWVVYPPGGGDGRVVPVGLES
jgi:hypothetical protein